MRFLKKIFFINILFFSFVIIHGCSGVKEKIGLIKKAPDEFQVYENKPLSLPPNFDLRPPVDGNIKNQEESSEKLIFSEDNEQDESLSLSDEILLISVGEKDSDKNIRKIINEENSIQEVEKSLLDQLLDFDTIFKVQGKEESNEINAEKEKERINLLKDEDKNIKVNNQATIIEKEGSLD